MWARFDENLDLPHGLDRKHHQSTQNHKMPSNHKMPLTCVITSCSEHRFPGLFVHVLD